MTKEELEKEAEEYIKANNLEWELECYRTSPIGEVKQAYIASAEPREKQIVELEKDYAELKKTYRKQRNKRIDELQKENAELKEKLEVVIALKNEEMGCIETDFNTFKSKAKEIIKN